MYSSARCDPSQRMQYYASVANPLYNSKKNICGSCVKIVTTNDNFIVAQIVTHFFNVAIVKYPENSFDLYSPAWIALKLGAPSIYDNATYEFVDSC